MSATLPIATNLYFDTHFHRQGVKLLPNEFYTTKEDMVLVTVLGSCVAACIQDRTAGIGGMNHFMLPDDGADVGHAAADSMRYGAYAMEVLINELIKAGGRRDRFEAKVFGGAAVLAGMTTMNIGDRNSAFVRRYLATENIRIIAEDLQGSHPRKVAYLPRTGQVMVKKLRLQQDPSVAERERALASQDANARAERLAKARERVELFGLKPGGGNAAGLRAGANAGAAAGTPAAAAPARARIELFGPTGGRPLNQDKTVEET
ncbi:chemoreceptor glutamine deamidase CheD [Paraburkholderia caballeronis]|uniref:Probable chemoreceptor glutamine deamidase CheD n=1 Tax=Paraburkholderia caballeronis TaxID=416943 RepID=A0A1H7SMQ6_9BURK|nr:chemoreceptor glutamine deamidase CheD [Paraburkholderia caballeronis]PXW22391.1 CheD activator of MCP protein methylation [Paraburkholderia caballeronis]PXW96049.1 CheD activator of MCP protein methylation [Paraburkholderia caballeronis]RAJ92415.1 CheD activator of MCP protein methylation [Paraburkholderia caballeronis]TDV08040.1 CheD activator of MCP protein methylation [Paraburkholderia caballeronis]TDV11896.1 CheD activator of MCP protein methylation [Paraburkholderia caballeronis]